MATTEEQIYEAIEKLSKKQENDADVSRIAFVSMSENGNIDLQTAAEHAEIFQEWAFPVQYEIGNLRTYAGALYRCIQAHTSQEDWTPIDAVSLWAIATDPNDEFPEWSQPIGAHDTYDNGFKVSHNGKKWVSVVANNVWEPGYYGWEEYNETDEQDEQEE